MGQTLLNNVTEIVLCPFLSYPRVGEETLRNRTVRVEVTKTILQGLDDDKKGIKISQSRLSKKDGIFGVQMVQL